MFLVPPFLEPPALEPLPFPGPYSAPPPAQVYQFSGEIPQYHRPQLFPDRFREIGAPEPIIALAMGLKLPELVGVPSMRGRKNLPSVRANGQLLTNILRSLNAVGVVRWPLPPGSPRPRFIEPLGLVPKSNGLPRLIYSQVRANRYILPRPCRYRGLDFALRLCR
jgi:hypothetical protein